MPQAILLQDVESLGERGSVVDVSAGYLRNYLLPRKLAERATAASIKAAQNAARRMPSAPRARPRSARVRTRPSSAARCSPSPSRPATTAACSAR